MAPIFAWHSETPWVELQLQAWTAPDDAAPMQLAIRGFTGLMWIGILVRVLLHVCQQYFRIARGARIRRLAGEAPGKAGEVKGLSLGAASRVGKGSISSGMPRL
jgi:hypothetical protein